MIPWLADGRSAAAAPAARPAHGQQTRTRLGPAAGCASRSSAARSRSCVVAEVVVTGTVMSSANRGAIISDYIFWALLYVLKYYENILKHYYIKLKLLLSIIRFRVFGLLDHIISHPWNQLLYPLYHTYYINYIYFSQLTQLYQLKHIITLILKYIFIHLFLSTYIIISFRNYYGNYTY